MLWQEHNVNAANTPRIVRVMWFLMVGTPLIRNIGKIGVIYVYEYLINEFLLLSSSIVESVQVCVVVELIL